MGAAKILTDQQALKKVDRDARAESLVTHCDTEEQARGFRAALAERLGILGLELHPEKTRIVYRKDANRQGSDEHTSVDFLGCTFRGRRARGRRGFYVAISGKAK